ncbi:hypothetical protein TNCV_3261821 [Trichonephila clavipes]|nr:hypothetical protein TNCV_3261821 [Trichonephila clavipes]
MVCDDNHEGFPVAICYSNRVCSFILEPFFEEIRNRLTHLQPKVFMSDAAAAFWNAWQMYLDMLNATCYAVGMYHEAGIGILVLK